jgi:hypothetical protein
VPASEAVTTTALGAMPGGEVWQATSEMLAASTARTDDGSRFGMRFIGRERSDDGRR